MNLRDKMIIEDYRKQKNDFERLGVVVHDMLNGIVKELGIMPLVIEHRVKGEDSLNGKLLKSDGWYKSFDELMDILGGRVVLYFADEVDAVSRKVEELFQIDKQFSSDKGKLLKDNSFGYLSVHYICTLREDMGYPPELLGKKFEIQIRSGLQHIWAAIVHDIAYKSKYGVPREINRGFSRLAGLFELADDEFMRVRDSMNDYQADIRTRIEENRADDVAINMISLKEYMLHNKEMRKFLKALAGIEGSEITETEPDSYIDQLASLGITTLGGVQNMLLTNGTLAYDMAKKTLSGTELDILSSNVALRFLCRAYMLKNNYSEEKIIEFLVLGGADRKRAETQAKKMIQSYANI